MSEKEPRTAGTLAVDETVRPRRLTPRGQRTRAALIRAARVIFERDGFLDSRLVDIAAEAGISVGSFYTYFTSKEEILLAVLEEVKQEMLQARSSEPVDSSDLPAVIAAAHRTYLRSYQENAALMKLLEQVAVIDDDFAAWRLARAEAFVERNARWIKRLQSRGQADPTLDADAVARALSAMIGRLAFMSCLMQDGHDIEELVDVCTRVWVATLKISESS